MHRIIYKLLVLFNPPQKKEKRNPKLQHQGKGHNSPVENCDTQCRQRELSDQRSTPIESHEAPASICTAASLALFVSNVLFHVPRVANYSSNVKHMSSALLDGLKNGDGQAIYSVRRHAKSGNGKFSMPGTVEVDEENGLPGTKVKLALVDADI